MLLCNCFLGGNQEELSFLTAPGLHIFGLVVMETVLFYSDWYTNSVYMVDRYTGRIDTLVSHLSRPTSIVVYHPANLTGQLEKKYLFQTKTNEIKKIL